MVSSQKVASKMRKLRLLETSVYPGTGVISQKNGISNYTTANPENSQYGGKLTPDVEHYFMFHERCFTFLSFQTYFVHSSRKWRFNKQYFIIQQETPDEILRVLSSTYDINSNHKTDPFLFYVLRSYLSLSQRGTVTWTREKQFHIKPEWGVT